MNNKKLNIRKAVVNEEQIFLTKVFDGNDLSEEKINIVDSIMGSGKTAWAIEKMKGND